MNVIGIIRSRGIYEYAKNDGLIKDIFRRPSFELAPKSSVDFEELAKNYDKQPGIIDSLKEMILNKRLKLLFTTQGTEIRKLLGKSSNLTSHDFSKRKNYGCGTTNDFASKKSVYFIDFRDKLSNKESRYMFDLSDPIRIKSKRNSFVRSIHDYDNGASIVTNGQGNWIIMDAKGQCQLQKFHSLGEVLKFCRENLHNLTQKHATGLEKSKAANKSRLVIDKNLLNPKNFCYTRQFSKNS